MVVFEGEYSPFSTTLPAGIDTSSSVPYVVLSYFQPPKVYPSTGVCALTVALSPTWYTVVSVGYVVPAGAPLISYVTL